MKQLTSRQTNAAALAIAAVAAWRLPNGYGLAENDSLFAGSAAWSSTSRASQPRRR